MAKYNILIPDVVEPPADVERAVFGKGSTVWAMASGHHSEIADEKWQNCHAILAFDRLDYNKKLLSKLKRCKVIVRVGVGYDNVDLIEAKNKKIHVCNVPDYGTEEVADHAMALLLSLVRGLSDFSESVKKRRWIRQSRMPFRLAGKVFGIVGLGRIGTAVAQRAKAFGTKVIFYDPYKQDGYDKALGVERVDELRELARRSDIISLHVPLNKETNMMINDKFFNDCKDGVVLINTARGAVIDLKALEKAMKDGKVKGCGLDVLPVEPSDDSQSLIVDYETDKEWLRGRLIVTPHVAFYSPEAFVEMRRKAALEAKRILDGSLPRNCVNA